jgi:hypothetical protein
MIATILIVLVMTLRLIANLANAKSIEERFPKLFFFIMEMSVFYAAGLFDKFI